MASNDLTQQIAARVHAVWDAYQAQDAAKHNSILADDYIAIHPDGTRHDRKPTAEEIASARMSHYVLSNLRAVALAPNVALVTFDADVEGPSAGQTVHAKFAVGNIWVRRHGAWVCRFYQGTVAK